MQDLPQKENSLTLFHPLIRQWFESRYGKPTEIQDNAWPEIAEGKHVLVTAPTGSGKTLTAFLWTLNQLITGQWKTGHPRVLYISPLKALNNDIYRNLLSPLEELRTLFQKEKQDFPEIHVQTRSGDTPQSERRQMLRHPPDILITTPESLNLLLSSHSGRSILTSFCTVILDEIHAVVGTKRGTHLITAVDRLIPLSGEFQRIALSATVKPLQKVADFIGGFRLDGDPYQPKYVPREVVQIQSSQTKSYDIQIRFPEECEDSQNTNAYWNPLVKDFKTEIQKNKSTLLFVNNRRLSEKLTLKINYEEDHPIAYAHHGSLSRELRTEVEKKLKDGELKAIVATNSLELGIDIGHLDEVLLIQSPPSVSSAIQRLGRAGHQVGEVSRGILYPTFNQDFLESAVLAFAITFQDIEEIKPVICPLDVLAQVLISMTGTETWDIDLLFQQIRTSAPYSNLTRSQFDLVLNMLAGRYADTRIRELKPRLSIDRLDNTVSAKKGVLITLYLSGGTIPDRGYFQLRHSENSALIGDLDEEFVWEAKIGQTFTLGSQQWKIERITHNDVFVLPASPKSIDTPFWKGEDNNRDVHFSLRLSEFLEKANNALSDPKFKVQLTADFCMEERAADHLIDYLKKQLDETGCDLPHRHHIVVEKVQTGPGGMPGSQLILHTLWGGKLNRPFALALDAAWEGRFGSKLEIYAGNDSIVLQIPEPISADELFSLVTPLNMESCLRKRLEGSGFFGGRFRECAGRALLITRNKFNERMPLWMSRLRSQKLLSQVMNYEDFPILLETWRTCLKDEFDLEVLQERMAELASGQIRISECRTTHPSPMARNLSWRQINEYMYRSDELVQTKTSKLRSSLLEEVVFTPDLRPAVSPEIIKTFEMKRHRLSPGYAPSTSRDLVDWVKERLLIPEPEWLNLIMTIQEDNPEEAKTLIMEASEKLVILSPPEAKTPLILAAEDIPKIARGFYSFNLQISVHPMKPGTPIPALSVRKVTDGEEVEALSISLLGQWLQFYGPRSVEFITSTLGIGQNRILSLLNDLMNDRKIISGNLIAYGSDEDICDSENFEILLRISRTEAIPKFEPVDIQKMPLFLAQYQGILHPKDNLEGLGHILEQLLCYPAPADQWETEFLPARINSYTPSWMESLLTESDLLWIGQDKQQILFAFDSDLDLLKKEELDSESKRNSSGKNEDEFPVRDLFQDPVGRYDFSMLLQISHLKTTTLTDLLWKAVWRGEISNDHFGALRKGIEMRFQLPDIETEPSGSRTRQRRSGTRARFTRWKSSLPWGGNWFLIPYPDLEDDLLASEERKKDRVRLLLDRYGILFRELLIRESPPFHWSDLFRSLRLMELSGEILSGYFFKDIPGPQFIAHHAFRMLQRELPEETIWWINAADPASCCGLQINDLKESLPARMASTHLTFHGSRLVFTSQRNGKALLFNCRHEDPYIEEYLAPLKHLLNRKFQPQHRIVIETINEISAAKSPYRAIIETLFETMIDYKNITLYRQIS